jgi:hypothetical protein
MVKRYTHWAVPELNLLTFPLIPFIAAYYIIKFITWPIHGPIRWAIRRRKKKLEGARSKQVADEYFAGVREAEAIRQAHEKEKEALRAAGEYVPYISENSILGVCSSAAITYGRAYALAHAGISREDLDRGLSHAEAKFGPAISQVFGGYPRSMLIPDAADFRMCVAVSAFHTAAEELEITTGEDGRPLIHGAVGSQALGVFARAMEVKPALDFSSRDFYDQFFVCLNFVPSRESAEMKYGDWYAYKTAASRDEYYRSRQEKYGIGPLPVTGEFGPRMLWAARLMK